MTTTALFTSVFMLIICGMVVPQKYEKNAWYCVKTAFAIIFAFLAILFGIVFFAMCVDNVVELVKYVCNIVYQYVA